MTTTSLLRLALAAFLLLAALAAAVAAGHETLIALSIVLLVAGWNLIGERISARFGDSASTPALTSRSL